MDSPCIKQTVCKVFKIFQCGKYLVAYVLKNFVSNCLFLSGRLRHILLYYVNSNLSRINPKIYEDIYLDEEFALRVVILSCSDV